MKRKIRTNDFHFIKHGSNQLNYLLRTTFVRIKSQRLSHKQLFLFYLKKIQYMIFFFYIYILYKMNLMVFFLNRLY